jgi:hypothetical protein
VISYSLWDTADAVTDQLHQNMREISVGGLMEPRGFGEEAYLLSKYSPDGHSNLYFRKRRVTMEISASDEDLIRRAARRIVQELDLIAARNP